MKSFWKLLGAIALVAIIGFSMVACGGEDPLGGGINLSSAKGHATVSDTQIS